MSDENNNPNEAAPAKPARLVGFSVYFNPDDPNFTVWTGDIEGTLMPTVSLAQMMLDEASRQMDLVRRMANGRVLARQIQDEQQTANMHKELSRGMHS